MPCSCPNRRRATRQRVSNPDCAADARPHSRPEQYRQSAAPLPIGGESPLRARTLASSFSATSLSLTVNRVNQMFWRFFVSLNEPVSSRFNGGTKFRAPKRYGIGANDARHREHLMAPARQLTSSASLKAKEVVEPTPGRVKRLVARATLRLSRIN